jgi:hypothetical protein
MRFTSDKAYILRTTSRTSSRQVKPVNEVMMLCFVPHTRPRESRCSGGRRRRGFRTRWPLSVPVVAVTGAVYAVTGVTCGRDSALDVTGTVPAVIAVAGCHSPSRRADCPGHVLLAPPVACSRNARLRDRSCYRSAGQRLPRRHRRQDRALAAARR